MSQCMRVYTTLTGGYPVNIYFFDYETKKVRIDTYPTQKEILENPIYLQNQTRTRNYIILQNENSP